MQRKIYWRNKWEPPSSTQTTQTHKLQNNLYVQVWAIQNNAAPHKITQETINNIITNNPLTLKICGKKKTYNPYVIPIITCFLSTSAQSSNYLFPISYEKSRISILLYSFLIRFSMKWESNAENVNRKFPLKYFLPWTYETSSACSKNSSLFSFII